VQFSWLSFGAFNVYVAYGGTLANLPRPALPGSAAAAAESMMLGPLFLVDAQASLFSALSLLQAFQ
jgi:hypothetical protein